VLSEVLFKVIAMKKIQLLFGLFLFIFNFCIGIIAADPVWGDLYPYNRKVAMMDSIKTPIVIDGFRDAAWNNQNTSYRIDSSVYDVSVAYSYSEFKFLYDANNLYIIVNSGLLVDANDIIISIAPLPK